MRKVFILENTNPRVINNYPIILEDEKELIEYLETCSADNSKHTIIYEEPIPTSTYYNLNGNLIKGTYEPIEIEE